jgi:hypothetical protein
LRQPSIRVGSRSPGTEHPKPIFARKRFVEAWTERPI